MKKLIVVIIAVLMLVSLVGCAAKEGLQAEEPVVEEPAAEEPVAEEPVAEEPVAEEPVVEEPVVEEPVEEPAAEPVLTVKEYDLTRVVDGLFFKPTGSEIMIALNGVTDETVQMSDPNDLTNPLYFTVKYDLLTAGPHDIEVGVIAPSGIKQYKAKFSTDLGAEGENTLDAYILMITDESGEYTAYFKVDGVEVCTATYTM